MQIVEQHCIKKRDPRYAIIDEAAFKSKNLYNAALYETRQAFIYQGRYLSYEELDRRMQSHEAYRALPAKVSQQVLKQLADAWKAFREARASYEQDPSQFTGRPCLPKYKHKSEGRNLLIYTDQAVSKRGLKRGLIQPSQLPISITTQQKVIDQVRIIPKKSYYVVEVVYSKEPLPPTGNPTYYAGIDLGINNLATVASNAPGFVPFIVNGRPVKSINQFYNKRRSELQQKLGRPGSTTRMERMTTKRNRRIDHYLHAASKQIINRLAQAHIGVLVIGKNDGWKQEVAMGKRGNQNFVQIPHTRFIHLLTYKAHLQGITVLITEESYTSKASFLDHDPLPARDEQRGGERYIFRGTRIKRGLYRASDGRLVNADWNGASNIIRKVAPNAFAEGVEDGKAVSTSPVVHPVRIVVLLTKPKTGQNAAKTSDH